jgi:hypothetical protein
VGLAGYVRGVAISAFPSFGVYSLLTGALLLAFASFQDEENEPYCGQLRPALLVPKFGFAINFALWLHCS